MGLVCSLCFAFGLLCIGCDSGFLLSAFLLGLMVCNLLTNACGLCRKFGVLFCVCAFFLFLCDLNCRVVYWICFGCLLSLTSFLIVVYLVPFLLGYLFFRCCAAVFLLVTDIV